MSTYQPYSLQQPLPGKISFKDSAYESVDTVVEEVASRALIQYKNDILPV